MKLAIIGNCQHAGAARCMKAMNSALDVVPIPIEPVIDKSVDLHAALQDRELIVTQLDAVTDSLLRQRKYNVVYYPRIYCEAFHPDMVYVQNGAEFVPTPMYHYHSKIVLFAYLRGLSVADTLRLFTGAVYEKLGYLEVWGPAKQALLIEGVESGFPLEDLLGEWSRKGCFMHSINHPRLMVLASVAKTLLQRLGIPVRASHPEDYLVDELAVHGAVWPVYPEIAASFGLDGHLEFKLPGTSEVISLREFVEGSFNAYGKYPREGFTTPYFASGRFQQLLDDAIAAARPVSRPRVHDPIESKRPESAVKGRSANPYQGLPPHHYWRKSVEAVPMSQIDPVVRGRFKIGRGDRVASAGSCFAQHITKALKKNGFNYFVAEAPPPGLDPETAHRRNFGAFSARFGNIYTARQLAQLFERAYGRFTPAEAAWERPDGRLADPFRPQIEPDGFADAAELAGAREAHLSAVRQMFESLDVFIFTLGLTEAWCSKDDGAVFPLAPGVVAGEMDPSRYEFVNFTAADVVADLRGFLDRLFRVNAAAKVLLTVSPVPLLATYEDRHVITSTTYSKAVLRVAADEVAKADGRVAYFPSFEIITAPCSRGAYFEDDARSVKPEGVEHVMRLFLKHYTDSTGGETARDREMAQVMRSGFDIICDEEQLDPLVKIRTAGCVEIKGPQNNGDELGRMAPLGAILNGPAKAPLHEWAGNSCAGYIDVVDDQQILGWARDSTRPNTPLKVDIYVDDAKVSTVSAGEFRADLRDANVGDGKHGFHIPSPAVLRDGKAHAVRVKVAGTGSTIVQKGVVLLRDSAPVALHELPYEELVQRIHEVARAELPPDATVLVAGKGADDLLQLDGREGWHFPRDKEGDYDGNPADSEDAVTRLEALRAEGGQYLLFPEPAFWWLEDYEGFKQHLDGRYARVYADECCVIYRLSPPGAAVEGAAGGVKRFRGEGQQGHE
jgi:hypothetical protein